MILIDILKRLMRGPPSATVPTRLTSAEAVALAQQAAGDHWLRNELAVATAQRHQDGRAVWVVETSGVGSHLRLVIDDASGELIDRTEHAGR
jgi:hypothetical protein